ncbi:protein kinase domain-containing protein [Ktedonobacter robiniae]|uniref:non-specific serine/threonine protein kinase n=1 Tax=Ktedonobacter robiniae TaxID=2778365 RepID=A0ABQ3UIX9_9CHLR|nr:protein kinase [Ktedonobacter robiniae]GHO52362.1 hypothetical protein KSB_08370 [Ktedonobacter robiniae]
MADLEGRTLDRYELRQIIGKGGMADVYEGYDTRFQRIVAVKVFKRDDEEMRRRFEREARVMAQLRHPYLIPIFDAGSNSVDGYECYYLVMPYLEGGTLRTRLRRSPLKPEDAARILRDIGSALDYIHARGIIHRDIKSSNVLLDNEGRCYLADFGIARNTGDVTQLTSTGFLMGTVDYMAPELFEEDHKADARSDLYGLGVLLFEMVTGRVPFEAANQIAVVSMHINKQPPSPRRYASNLPVAAEKVILKSLEKRPELRYSSATEMADAFTNALQEQPQAKSEPKGATPHSDRTVRGEFPAGTMHSARTERAEAAPAEPSIHSLRTERADGPLVLPAPPAGQRAAEPNRGQPPYQAAHSPQNYAPHAGTPTREQAPRTSQQNYGQQGYGQPQSRQYPPEQQRYGQQDRYDQSQARSASSPQHQAPRPRPATPTPPPEPPSPNRGYIMIGVALLILLIIAVPAYMLLKNGTPGTSNNGTNGSSATATSTQDPGATQTAQAQAQATQQAQATASIIRTATATNAVYQDPLTDAGSEAGWESSSSCSFIPNEGYHVTVAKGFLGSSSNKGCSESQKQFGDQTISVDMLIKSGDGGGVYFRVAKSVIGTYAGYLFQIGPDGHYKISSSGNFSTGSTPLKEDTITTGFHTGPGVKNTLQIIAHGTTLSFYVNNTFVASLSNADHPDQGVIAFLANAQKEDADVVYSNLKVFN